MTFQFEDFALDPVRRELARAGALIAVEPQVFDLIHYLVRERERVVTKDDLFDAIWNGRVVSESTLTTRINAARRALDDSGAEQRLIRTVQRKGFRFVAEVREQRTAVPSHLPSPAPKQEITFCKTSDGVRLAIGKSGEGNPIVKVSNWMNHVAFDFENPLWSHLYRQLADGRKFVHYDGRGVGLSDRIVKDISFESFVTDLETVIDSLDVEKVSLVGMSMGAPTAIAYAARHPERIHKMVLHGGFAIGRRRRNAAADLERADLFLSLMRQGWGKPDAAFIKAFACIYFPNATEEQLRWFTDLQQQNTSAETAVRIRAACDDIDVTELLPLINAPVLVTHCQNDQVVPFEQGRQLASMLPNATLLPLPSENHMVLHTEPAGATLTDSIVEFVRPDGRTACRPSHVRRT